MSEQSPQRVDEVSESYVPAKHCDTACGWLYYLLVAISIAVLFADAIEAANWWGHGKTIVIAMKVGFLLTIVLFFLFLISKLVLIPSAEKVRRKQLLTDSYGATITPETTVGYYNNGFPPSTQRLAANVMENSLFGKVVARKMLPMVRTKTFLYFAIWLVILAIRQRSLDLVIWISQLVFSIDILAYWLSLELLRLRHSRVYEDLYQHFLHNHGEETPEGRATILDLFATYESGKAVVGVLLDSKIFFRENSRISNYWNEIRGKLSIP